MWWYCDWYIDPHDDKDPLRFSVLFVLWLILTAVFQIFGTCITQDAEGMAPWSAGIAGGICIGIWVLNLVSKIIEK